MIENFVVQSESSSPGGDCHGAYDAQAIVALRRVADGSVPGRRPNLSPKRLQHKATFVKKNKASIAIKPLFLAAATRPGASVRWRPRHVRGPGARVSERSSPVRATACLHSRRDSRPETVAQSAPLPAGNSTHKLESPNVPHRRSMRPANACGQQPSAAVWALDATCDPEPTGLRSLKHPATALPMMHWHQLLQPLPSTSSLAQEAGLQSFDELPAPRDFREVSYHNYMIREPDFPLTT